MLNGFVGEFLILTASMQSPFAHRHLWTALATSGVILSAAYMLSMIQRVFYGDLSSKPERLPTWDLDAREHLALWPMVALFLLMGVASSIWLKAIDATVLSMDDHFVSSQAHQSDHVVKIEAETYRPIPSPAPPTLLTAPGGAR
jgi:NADH-quinone oxidoreductase subunit M